MTTAGLAVLALFSVMRVKWLSASAHWGDPSMHRSSTYPFLNAPFRYLPACSEVDFRRNRRGDPSVRFPGNNIVKSTFIVGSTW
jgi:hypothetical protein